MSDKKDDISREDGPFEGDDVCAYKLHVKEDGKTTTTKFDKTGKEIEDPKPTAKAAPQHVAPVVGPVKAEGPK